MLPTRWLLCSYTQNKLCIVTSILFCNARWPVNPHPGHPHDCAHHGMCHDASTTLCYSGVRLFKHRPHILCLSNDWCYVFPLHSPTCFCTNITSCFFLYCQIIFQMAREGKGVFFDVLRAANFNRSCNFLRY